MNDPIHEVLDATWPAASVRKVGGFRVREGRGGGSRVSCASLDTAFEEADIDAAEAAHRALRQQPKFMIRDGDEALDKTLETRGYELCDPVVIYTAPVTGLPTEAPPLTAFAHWPPLAITREIWARTDIGPERQAVIERAAMPKTAILGRMKDRAAGAGFVAIHDGMAMIHGLAVLPEFRRHGLARALMAEANRWAIREGAGLLALAARRENPAACALCDALGMSPRLTCHYRRLVT